MVRSKSKLWHWWHDPRVEWCLAQALAVPATVAAVILPFLVHGSEAVATCNASFDAAMRGLHGDAGVPSDFPVVVFIDCMLVLTFICWEITVAQYKVGTGFLTSSRRYAGVCLAIAAFYSVIDKWRWCWHPVRHPQVYQVAWLVGWTVQYFKWCWQFSLLLGRVDILERVLEKHSHGLSPLSEQRASAVRLQKKLGTALARNASWAIVLARCLIGIMFLLGAGHIASGGIYRHLILYLQALVALVVMVLLPCTMGAIVRIFYECWTLADRRAGEALNGDSAAVRKAKQKALTVAQWQTVGAAAAFVTISLAIIGQLLDRALHSGRSYAFMAFTAILDNVVAILTVALLSGMLKQQTKKALHLGDKIAQRVRKKTVAWVRPVAAAAESPEWNATRDGLAWRGFTLEALLGFYKCLGSDAVMPDFDPEVHTTSDVVVQAVIPLTRGDRCALSTKLMGGRPVLPGTLVTHSWGNLFAHLVASLIADALGGSEIEDVVEELSPVSPAAVDTLMRLLAERGTLQSTYWICAVSVNQHASICGQHGCDCALPKHSAGDLSEMNKFACMMDYLALQNPRFRQLIALDEGCKLFTRAWCVAEIYKAWEADIGQKMVLFSVASIVDHKVMLQQLRVRDMEASRPEDKKMILDSIEDIQVFDDNLQKLIFDSGGLTDCYELDDFELLGTIMHMREEVA